MKTALYIVGTIVGLVLLVAVINLTAPPSTPLREVPYSSLLNEVEQGKVRQVTLRGNRIMGVFNNGERFTSYAPPSDQQFVDRLVGKNVVVAAGPAEDPVALLGVLINWVPLLLYLGSLWLFVGRPLRRIERRLEALQSLVATGGSGPV